MLLLEKLLAELLKLIVLKFEWIGFELLRLEGTGIKVVTAVLFMRLLADALLEFPRGKLLLPLLFIFPFNLT